MRFGAADITFILQGLAAKGALVQEGQARWSRYRLPMQVKNSIHMAEDSLHKIINPIDISSQDRHIFMQFNDDELAQLYEIAAPARQNRRLIPKNMEKIIRMLCMVRWFTKKQLATLVNLNSEGLLARFLTPMVVHNILCLQYPDKPNQAEQAYSST